MMINKNGGLSGHLWWLGIGFFRWRNAVEVLDDGEWNDEDELSMESPRNRIV